MRINRIGDNDQPSCFADLSPGQVFADGSEIFIKLQEGCKFQAVCLETGRLIFMRDDSPCYKVDRFIVVELE